MKKTILMLALLTISGMQANKVLTSGNETPEQMDQLVQTYGIQNQSVAPISTQPTTSTVRQQTVSSADQRYAPTQAYAPRTVSTLPIMAY